MFGHRPKVLQSIRDAYGRGVGYDRLAEMVSKDGETISGSAMRKWLVKEGLIR